MFFAQPRKRWPEANRHPLIEAGGQPAQVRGCSASLRSIAHRVGSATAWKPASRESEACLTMCLNSVAAATLVNHKVE
ncbi:hypothetical protein [Ralstonia solanacearum]|uniref:Uncharacterized protein n=1 Tax=Ralstonia solanacearum (strain Po82) TaxID=1031711 RepID=F6G8M1_RALS8|nr:hypothetical protein [Ralstonia solanacearum]AEG71112.1 hypothetical protein RSPO_m00473 [Ralstonia solanacearum Po82]AMP71419.1 hypothetical protein UW163_18000 [Ralstonia solanacearum]AMP75851.1 hypothetical protein RALBFv3_16640 [Ralstonia solanacearum]MBB6588496.1 hypothetical protein [Ralstonia solanacearum]MCG3575611.1 hypothetical protein [Ralstonia solanacearum]